MPVESPRIVVLCVHTCLIESRVGNRNWILSDLACLNLKLPDFSSQPLSKPKNPIPFQGDASRSRVGRGRKIPFHLSSFRVQYLNVRIPDSTAVAKSPGIDSRSVTVRAVIIFVSKN